MKKNKNKNKLKKGKYIHITCSSISVYGCSVTVMHRCSTNHVKSELSPRFCPQLEKWEETTTPSYILLIAPKQMMVS